MHDEGSRWSNSNVNAPASSLDEDCIRSKEFAEQLLHFFCENMQIFDWRAARSHGLAPFNIWFVFHFRHGNLSVMMHSGRAACTLRKSAAAA